MSSKRNLILFIIGLTIFIFAETAISPIKASVEPQAFPDELFLSQEDKSYFKNLKTETKKKYIVVVTGYSSSYDETDEDPYITASGEFVKEGIVATNFLPIGTHIKIPALFGNKVFVVKDRMNPRYYYRVDIWFPSKEEALHFGIHYNVEIEIVD